MTPFQMATADIPEVRCEVVEKNYTVAKLLAENSQLVASIAEFQKRGRIEEAVGYQQILHRNLMYLMEHINPACLENVDNLPPTSSTNSAADNPTKDNQPTSPEPEPRPCSSTDPIPSSSKTGKSQTD